MDIRVVDGDITQVRADALITAYTAESSWLGGIDGAIVEASKNQYHTQFATELALNTTDTIEAVCVEQRAEHSGAFRDVIFVLDELRSLPMETVVKRGLDVAIKHGHSDISMPVFRQGTMPGVLSAPTDEVYEMIDTLRTYVDCGISHLTIVTRNNPALHQLVHQALVT